MNETVEYDKISEYEVTKAFRSPNAKKFTGKEYRTFNVGTKVKGFVYKGAQNNGVTMAPQIIAFGEWVIPLSNVKKIKDLPATEKLEETVIANTDNVAEKTRKEFEKITNTNLVQSVVSKSQKSVKGLLLGGLAGALFAMYYKKNPMMGIVIGSVIGGLVAGFIPAGLQKAYDEKVTA